MSLPRLEEINDVGEFLAAIAEVLGEQIGKYFYDPTDKTKSSPAVFIVKDHDTDPPRDWVRSGIELLVYEPEIKSRDYLATTGFDQIYRGKLIQHDKTKRLNMAKATLFAGLILLQEKSHLARSQDLAEELNFFYTETVCGEFNE